MARKRKRDALDDAEIIIKDIYEVVGRGRPYPIPSLLLLANRAGWAILARCCRRMMKCKKGTSVLDPENYWLLFPSHFPVNQMFSDETAVRGGILTDLNRRAVFKKIQDFKTHSQTRRP